MLCVTQLPYYDINVSSEQKAKMKWDLVTMADVVGKYFPCNTKLNRENE